MQSLRKNRRLNKGESDLCVGNGKRVVALAIWTYVLNLPSGLLLNLDDCYYVPALTKNIIYFSYLNTKYFHLTFSNNGCSIMLNVLFASDTLYNGIHILDMFKLILVVHDNKRHKKDNLKSSYLWYSCLGHICERRMTKLHKEGSLWSFDYESYDTCESCLLGKMMKFPFKRRGECANRPLNLIHSDVCGLMSTHARGGFIYFITFIDYHSLYGYLCLMGYKYEAYQKFKKLRNEVETTWEKY